MGGTATYVYAIDETLAFYKNVYTEISKEAQELIISSRVGDEFLLENNALLSSRQYKNIVRINEILNQQYSAQDITPRRIFENGFRTRGVIYHTDPSGKTSFLTLRKHSHNRRHPDFYELTFKGGFERRFEPHTKFTTIRELHEEVYPDNSVFEDITYTFFDPISSLETNADIMITQKKSSTEITIHVDFLTTYFIKAKTLFDPRNYWETIPPEKREHLDAQWGDIKQTRIALENARAKGFDRDYYLFTRIFPHISFEKLTYMTSQDKNVLTRQLHTLLENPIVPDSFLEITL